MNCEHCNNLRRAEGGVKIGGRVELLLVPTCGCNELPTANIETVTTVEDVTMNTISPEFYFREYPMKICPFNPQVNGRPDLLSVEVQGVAPEEYTYLAFTRFYDADTETCIFNPFLSPQAYCNNSNGFMESYNFWTSRTATGEIKYVRILIQVFPVVAFAVPPVINFTYDFSL